MPYETRSEKKRKDCAKSNESCTTHEDQTAAGEEKVKSAPNKLKSTTEPAKEQEQQQKMVETPIFATNLPEKIVIVFDRACDELHTSFDVKNGPQETPINMLKKSLKFFLHNKSFINPKHEFALMLLDESTCTWAVNFTTNIGKIVAALNVIEECEAEDVFNMNSVFETIMEKISLPSTTCKKKPPTYVVHAIFLYNRSYTIPELAVTEEMNNYLESPLFMFDVLITHEIPEANNHCQKIIDILHGIDKKDKAFSFPVARNTQLLQESMAKLMAHPLQRQKQDFSEYPYVTQTLIYI